MSNPTREAIAEAAITLDGEYPNWEDVIDVEILDMSTVSNCILGQLYEDYHDGIRKLRLEHKPDKRAPFCCSGWHWKEEIHTRRSKKMNTEPEMMLLVGYSGETLITSDDAAYIAGAEAALQKAGVKYTKFMEVK